MGDAAIHWRTANPAHRRPAVAISPGNPVKLESNVELGVTAIPGSLVSSDGAAHRRSHLPHRDQARTLQRFAKVTRRRRSGA
jgi:hypothetical protein